MNLSSSLLQLFILQLQLIITLSIRRWVAPAFHWHFQNEIFKRENGTRKLCRDPAHLYLEYNTDMIFICAHTHIDVVQGHFHLQEDYLYDNLHMVTKKGFETCTADIEKGLLIKCDTPWIPDKLKFDRITFNILNWNMWSFLAGNTYYFINTSNGTANGLNRKSGGRCVTHNMKFKVTVCHEAEDCPKCKDMCCEKPLTTKPPTTTPTTKPTTKPTTTPTTEQSTTTTKITTTVSKGRSVASRKVDQMTKKTTSTEPIKGAKPAISFPTTPKTTNRIEKHRTTIYPRSKKSSQRKNHINKEQVLEYIRNNKIDVGKYYSTENGEKTNSDTGKHNIKFTFIGIAVGCVLSVLVILAGYWLHRKWTVRDQKRTDSHSPLNVNGKHSLIQNNCKTNYERGQSVSSSECDKQPGPVPV